MRLQEAWRPHSPAPRALLHLREHINTDLEPYFHDTDRPHQRWPVCVLDNTFQCCLQPAEAAEFLLSSPNVFCHQWMVKEPQREFGSGTLFLFLSLSASVLRSSLHWTAELKKAARMTSQDIMDYSRFYIMLSGSGHMNYSPELRQRRAETQAASGRDHSRMIQASSSWQVEFVFQLLTTANFNQITAAVWEGPTETGGQRVECFCWLKLHLCVWYNVCPENWVWAFFPFVFLLKKNAAGRLCGSDGIKTTGTFLEHWV